MQVKKTNIIVTAISFMLMCITSCTQSEDVHKSGSDDVLVSFNFSDIGSSRSYVDVANEGTIKQLRVFVYTKEGTSWVFDRTELFNDFNNGSIMKVSPGVKRFYFFANDDKAVLYSASKNSIYTFSSETGYTEQELKDIVIDRFTYNSPLYDRTDLLPMTGLADEKRVSANSNNTISCQMTRAVSKVSVSMKVSKKLDSGKSLKIKYVSVGNIPSREYFYPRMNTENQVALPSYSVIDYAHAVTYTPSTEVQLTAMDTPICNLYLHENPFGKKASAMADEENHLSENGYIGTASRLNLFYEYSDGTQTIQKGVLTDLPYIIRNNNLKINVTVMPPDDSETFDINVKVVANWDQRNEDVPVFN